MGNSGSNQSSFEENNWRKIGQKGDRTILYNDITMKSVQRHEAVLDCDEGEAISMCKWREGLPQDCCIVELYEYGIKRAGMCNSQSDLYVITERIHLLQQIGAISKSQAFLVLRDVATGLRILFKKFGFFNPRPNLIGINSEGRAKIWTNQNFAKSQPEKDTIPIESSQLGIVNNLIRILEAKTYPDSNLPIDYPKNLDLNSVVNYINKVFAELRGFEVDRIYIDRAEFTKKYNELRQRQQKEEQSRMIASEAQRRFIQIQALHQNLRLQQLELARREQQLKLQAQQQQEFMRQQSIQRQIEMQRQMELQKQLQVQKQKELQTVIGMQKQQQFQQRIHSNQLMEGQIMKGTISTMRSDAYGPGYINSNSQLTSNPSYGNLLIAPQVQTHLIHQSPQNNKFNQISSPSPSKYQQAQIIYHQQIQAKPTQIGSPRPPLPPKNQQQVRQITSKQRQQTYDHNENIRKQIEMVDSMILMQEDDMSDQQNKRYVESRILKYKI